MVAYLDRKVLQHSVHHWNKGEHYVIAHFMKDKVQDRVGVPRPAFPLQTEFLHLLGADQGVKRAKKKLRHEVVGEDNLKGIGQGVKGGNKRLRSN